MSISFSSATGNLFNRLGKLGLLIKQVSSYQSSQVTNATNTTTGVVAQYNSEPDLQALMGSAYISNINSAGDGIGSVARNIARQTINRVVYRDNPRISQNLTSLNIIDSIKEVIRQMNAQGASIFLQTVAGSGSAFTGTGNGVINVSVKRPQDGRTQELLFAETLLVKCTQDSFTGGATAGNENLTIYGQGNQSDVFAFDWPLGSNSRSNLNSIDGDVTNGSNNLLNNSGFASWTSNVPNQFTLTVGVAGTNTIQNGSITYSGGSSLQIVGDGSNTLTELRQQFNNSSGTTNILLPLTQYGVCIFARRDSVAAAQGILTIDLFDGTNIINDAAGNPNSFTIDLTALTTNFQSFTGAFRTPSSLPTNYYIRLRLSTSLTNGRSVYFDKLSLGEMTECYASGPYVSVHTGNVNFVQWETNPFFQGDYATITTTNSRGSGGTLNTFPTLCQRFFFSEMMGNELLFPSSVSNTISDSLIG